MMRPASRAAPGGTLPVSMSRDSPVGETKSVALPPSTSTTYTSKVFPALCARAPTPPSTTRDRAIIAHKKLVLLLMFASVLVLPMPAGLTGALLLPHHQNCE